MPGVTVDSAYQLAIEDAANIAEYDEVIFVDAEREGADPYSIGAVQPAADITFTSHLMSPESVVALCEQMYGKTPSCWLMGVRGYDFDLGETLTERAEKNLEKALSFVIDFVEKKIQEGKEYEHNGTQDNPHHR
jgi:hydrogenase maturation protease